MKNRFQYFFLPFLVALLITMVNCEKEEPVKQFALNTLSVNNITFNTAQSGGNISSDGGRLITTRGIVWGINNNPTVEQNIGISMDGSGSGVFRSDIIGLQPNTTFFVRAYATNEESIVYGNEQEFKTPGTPPTVTTYPIINFSNNSATGGGNVTHDGGFTVTTRGIVLDTLQNPNLERNVGSTIDGMGPGSFASNLSGLTGNTTYYVRAYATNSTGTEYGQQVSFTSSSGVSSVVNPITGRIWMDRNLGASRVATSSTNAESYGDLYQWGRDADGHQLRASDITLTQSSSDNPGHGSFIVVHGSPEDWRSPQNENLWQGVYGINNPCPAGFRLPTEVEWEEERQSWHSNDASGAFNSPLKLPMAGIRMSHTGFLEQNGSTAMYWSGTVSDNYRKGLSFSSNMAGISTNNPASGCSVRCIKD